MGRIAKNLKLTIFAVGIAITLVASAGPAHATFSGRNGLIAYNSGAPALPVSNTSGTRIFASRPDGTRTRNLTPGLNNGEDFNPSWSPNGRRLAFHSQRSGATEVWTMGANGRARRQVTSSGFSGQLGDAVPSYSPNGRRIAFSCGGFICTMRADGSDRRTITTPPAGFVDDVPVWDPRSRRIAFVRRPAGGAFGDPGQCFSVLAGGGGQVRLTTAGCSNPDFSPDGSQIVFSSSRTGLEFLWTMRRDGSAERRVAGTRGLADPVFSPNGRRIAAVGLVGGDFEIFTVLRRGGGRFNVSTNPGRGDTRPTWQSR